MGDDRGKDGPLSTADLRNDVQPAGARVRLVHKPADYEDLPHLSEKEKEVAGKVLVDYLENFGTETSHYAAAMLNDPALYVTTTIGFQNVKKLIMSGYVDKQVRGSAVNMMFINIMKHVKCQQGLETFIENYVGRESFDPRKAVMIDFPDSDIFTPEERLAIKFSNAVLKSTMTDEIFNEAVERWGVKMTLRYISFIGEYLKVAMILTSLGITGAYNGNPDQYRHGYRNDEAFEKECRNLEIWQKELEDSVSG